MKDNKKMLYVPVLELVNLKLLYPLRQQLLIFYILPKLRILGKYKPLFPHWNFVVTPIKKLDWGTIQNNLLEIM